MASNSTDWSTIAYMNFIAGEFNRYIPVPCLILGSIGNILNVLVFAQPLLRKNPCSLYFISGSLVNILSLYVGLVTAFLRTYGLDPTQKLHILCKIRFYLRYTSITLSTWFILLACLDRCFSTSPNINFRLWSSVHLAKRIICLTTIIGFLFPYSQVFYCYTVDQKGTCTFTISICKLVNDTILLICNSGIPPILMIFISLSTIRHVRVVSRINARRRRDVQLTRILFIQVILVVLCAVPIMAQKIYSFITLMRRKSEFMIAVDNIISQVSVGISYINSSTSFSIYSLTSKTFRKEVVRIFLPILTCRCWKRNAVHPVPVKVQFNSNATVIRNEHPA